MKRFPIFISMNVRKKKLKPREKRKIQSLKLTNNNTPGRYKLK